jgi:phospho-N-acetylmuramoyl-pentapeptide-transferase
MRGILLAGAFSAILAFFLSPLLIKVLTRRGIGQVIRTDGPTTHQVKSGTPTMGGVAIIFAATMGYLASHLIIGVPVTTSAILVLALVAGIGFIGFIDDWLKISRRNSKGLSAKLKLLGQALIAIAFAIAGRNFPDERGLTPISDQLSTVRDSAITLAPILVILLALVMILGTSNAVNLTDGLDGLASGAAILSFLAFILIGVWEFGQSCGIEPSPKCYEVRDPLDLAVLAAAFAGALAGFLWWNTAPAQIYMRHRIVSHRCGSRRPGAHASCRIALDSARRTLRHHHSFGHHSDRLLQALRGKARIQDGTASSSLRTLGME